jgi:hypothetical protein
MLEPRGEGSEWEGADRECVIAESRRCGRRFGPLVPLERGAWHGLRGIELHSQSIIRIVFDEV